MSIRAERILIGLLPDRESIEVLMREGFHPPVLPTEELAPVVQWSLDYYTTSAKAPTVEALKDRFGDLLSDFEVNIDEEPEESIEWALETLQGTYLKKEASTFTRRLAIAVTEAPPEDRLVVMAEHSSQLAAIVADLIPRTTRVDFRETAQAMVADHDVLANDPGSIRGLAFGLDQIDEHYNGVHDGEIAVVAAPPKMGKSWFLNYVALKEWQRGRAGVLYTLENSIEMTQRRIACMATGVSLQELQTGRLNEADRTRLVEWVDDVLTPSDTPLHILRPPNGQRTPHALVQQALALEADSIIVDQLTFVEPSRRRRDQSRVYELAEIMRDFKTLVSAGRKQLPLLLAHQINRDGVKQAEKTGWLHMGAMADSSEVERASDFVFGLYAPEDMRLTGGMQFQGLAARRVPTKSYDLHWMIEVGAIGVRNEVEFE